MLGDIVKSVVLLTCVSFAAAMIMNKRAASSPAKPQAVAAIEAPVKRSAAVTETTSSGGRVTIPKSARDGQFWTTARVNNRSVKFLVDTGASAVALTPEDAKAAGINPRTLDYNIRISTANGEGRAARVTLKSVKVGTIRVRNVPAMVVEKGLGVSLLGMTYLGEIKKIEVKNDTMVLRN